MSGSPLFLELGDILLLRKKHPCGSDQWEVVRLGADIRIRCLGCGHFVLLHRSDLEHMIRKKMGSTRTGTDDGGGVL